MVVRGEKLFNGRRMYQNYRMEIWGGHIVSLEENRTDQEQNVLDTGAGLVTPGLIDCHVHILLDPEAASIRCQQFDNAAALTVMAVRHLQELLQEGVTFIRDAGAPGELVYQLQELLIQKKISGPSIQVCGRPIGITGGHGDAVIQACDGTDEVRKAVRQTIRQGADFIKLMGTSGITAKGPETAPWEMELEEIQTAVREAHKKGRKVAVHAHGNTGIRYAVEAGVDSVEHGTLLDQETAEKMKQKGITLVPTLSAPWFAVKEGLARNPDSNSHQKTKVVMEGHRQAVRAAWESGVKLAFGTDSGTPYNLFNDITQELILLADLGIPMEEVFRIATINGAELLGIEQDYGTLEAGKVADFIIYSEDPMDNPENLRAEKQVYKHGEGMNI